MNIAITSSRGEVSVGWSDYALLRDNIQHFMESGTPSARFAAIHAFEQAVDTGSVAVDANRLHEELLAACYGLRRLHLQDCAISLRTRSVTTGCADRPRRRGTIRARFAGWTLPTRRRTGSLIRHLRPFISTLLAVTDARLEGEQVEVRVAAPAARVFDGMATAADGLGQAVAQHGRGS